MKPFFERLRNYYLDVAKVLRGESEAASVFANTTDVGMSREHDYIEFLRQHAPSKCNVFAGGFLFGHDGSESKQMDVLITTDSIPRFNLKNRDGQGKSFSPVEGTIGVASIKSMLDKNGLEDALTGIASIPPTESLEGRLSPLINYDDYGDWPYKIVYATDGISLESTLKHLAEFYKAHPEIPPERQPNCIHVSGKYAIFKAVQSMIIYFPETQRSESRPKGSFVPFTHCPDLDAMMWILDELTQRSWTSSHIIFKYSEIWNRVSGGPG